MTDVDAYITDEAEGGAWRLLLGDSCERMAELDSDSIDLSIFSPPFASLFTYSPSIRDLGNCATRAEFFEHYAFIVTELLRVTKPGRLACVHVAQIATTKVYDGATAVTDFRGEVIRAMVEGGWLYHGEATIDKNPQAQAVRTHAQGLLFVQLRRDSSMSRPALADYVLLFRKPGENTTPILPDVDNDTWIEWARPVWFDIRESDTLNAAVARTDADERHICPLQLPLIERCVRLWSNQGETVFSPFAGIGSEGYGALKLGRRFVGIELKPSYWRVAVDNLRRAEYEANLPSLFGEGAAL
jgi:DNA modification methylase